MVLEQKMPRTADFFKIWVSNGTKMTHFELLLKFGDNDFLFPLSRDNSAVFPVITRDNSGNFALSLEVFYDHSDKKSHYLMRLSALY